LAGLPGCPRRDRADFPDSAPLPPAVDHRKRRARRLLRTGGSPDAPTGIFQAKEILDLVRLRAEPDSRVEGLGAAGLKKLELARALATKPKLLLADESLGGLDEQEMNQVPICSRRSGSSAALPSSGSSTSWAR